MMFRIRRYQVVPGKIEAFNDFFLNETVSRSEEVRSPSRRSFSNRRWSPDSRCMGLPEL